MSAPLTLSVVVVARNEAGNLPRCLAGLRDWASEILVALNDTTDRSADIARGLGARVETLPWRGYRDTKNAALDLATQPWALCLDADEEVSPALKQDIISFFARPDRDRFAGARFPRKVWFLGRWITHGDWYPDYSLRLVRRGAGRWGGDAIVHEKMACDGPVETLRGDLHHYSFPTLSSHVSKIVPFSDLYLQQQKARAGRFSAGAAFGRPLWRFFRAYIIRRGFLDGFPGFYIAWANAFGVLVRQGRLYEEEHGRAP
jgi:glycosyltransferase involved in cell wall biosynthesis